MINLEFILAELLLTAPMMRNCKYKTGIHVICYTNTYYCQSTFAEEKLKKTSARLCNALLPMSRFQVI